MFTSYLRITLRNLYKDKYYALINISGVAIAMACCLILGLYVNNELTYDRHFDQHERTYRVVNLLNNNGFIEDYSRIPQLVGPLMERDYVEVQDHTRLINQGTTLVRYEDRAFYQDDLLFADPNVFGFFSHEIIAGDPDTALNDPFAIAISQSFANTYFGDDEAMGKILSTDSADYRVSLVFADLPQNTHLKYDALMSTNQLDPVTISDLSSERGQNSLFNTNTWTYLLLPEGYDRDRFAVLSESFVERYLAPGLTENESTSYYLEPLAGIHLNSTTLGTNHRVTGLQYMPSSVSGCSCSSSPALTTSIWQLRVR